MRTSVRALRCLLGLATLIVAACAQSDAASEIPIAASTAPSANAVVSASPLSVEEPSSWKRCADRIAKVRKDPAEPGAPKYEKTRTLMAAVRGHSLLWKRAPAPSPKLDKLRKDAVDRVALMNSLRDFLGDLKRPEARREHVLREGYLWADDINLALGLVEQTSLTQLFREETAYLQRGLRIYELHHREGDRYEKEHYVYGPGPLEGERAEILVGDRVAVTKQELEQAPPLHIDLRDIVEQSDFDRLVPVHLTPKALVAKLRYGDGTWVEGLFQVDGARLVTECEVLTPELLEKKHRFVEQNRLRRKAFKRMREVVRAMVRDQIPFDAAPEQKNGFLRKAWLRAYLKGWKNFNFEGKSWPVYAKTGNARPPQVCSDFLTDVLERSSGTWYEPFSDNAKPARSSGGIDFDKVKIENRRSVAAFADFARANRDLLDLWEFPKEARIPFKKREPFFDMLSKNADRIIEGDMLTIHGYKEGGRPHYHSVIVLEKDPVTGLPSLVGGNAVFAREQTLDGVMQISPHRSLKHRFRVLDAWLEKIVSSPERPR